MTDTGTAATGKQPRERRSLRMRQVVGLSLTLLALVIVVSATVGAFAISRLDDSRGKVLDHLEPATNAALRLENALVDQETGIRGWILTGDARFREPYTLGRAEEDRAADSLRTLLPGGDPELLDDLTEVQRKAAEWRTLYAEPALAGVPQQAGGSDEGKALFDAVRGATRTQQENLAAERSRGRAELSDNAGTLTMTMAVVAALFAAMLVAVALLLRRTVTRPLEVLGAQVRRITEGDYKHRLTGEGPAEFGELAADVSSMRDRIISELDTVEQARAEVDRQAEELRRSNAELEQFAYVASHDLQEPLRKVASFCQLLEKRYKGQMDERADQYIAFAVDGAKRMQTLINDLLAFSRVGRLDTERAEVDLQNSLDRALHALASAREETGARITADPLPTLPGDPLLLGQLVQNLIGNAIKFHGDEPPRVHVGARWDGDQWEFTCADNGIGIEEQYADRIFVIFQRLHPKDAYAGTGIGLAMCKKIVEYHGGRIWLDSDGVTPADPTTGHDAAGTGTTIRWTLPGPAPEPGPEETAAAPEADGEAGVTAAGTPGDIPDGDNDGDDTPSADGRQTGTATQATQGSSR